MKKIKSLRLRARAKINLWLFIGPRDKSGFHPLSTVFQEIELNDTLIFKLNGLSKTRLTVTPPILPAGSDNLVIRALDLLRQRLKIQNGLDVELLKRIPIGAGLGGGSSDAACALWGGWILWKNGLSDFNNRQRKVPAHLLDCARQLGSDVPFFLQGGRAYGEGRGDLLTPFPTGSKRWLILVYPRVHVSTKEAYKLLDKARSQGRLLFKKSGKGKGNLSHPTFHPWGGAGEGNDFEPVIFKKFPEIIKVKRALHEAGCSPVQMSGSGSSVFGFVTSRKAGENVRRALSRYSWDVYLTRSV